MKRLRYGALAILCLIFRALPCAAAQELDVNSALYADLQMWEDRGIISGLPALRPFPLQLTELLLREVIAKGDQSDAARAAAYLEAVANDANIHLDTYAELRANGDSLNQAYYSALDVAGLAAPGISYFGKLGVVAATGLVGDGLPYGMRSDTDAIYDTSVAPLGSTGLTPRVSTTGGVAFGSDTVYFQAGAMRSSFGPFDGESIILSPSAPPAGHISFTVRNRFFSYSSLLLDLAASSNDGTLGPFPNKFLSLHSLEVTPVGWLSLGFIDAVVWGNRFDPTYLIPFPAILFFAQGLSGYADNSFLGITAAVTLPDAVRLNFLLFADDIGFNQLIKLDFNTMYKLAAQAGVSWTPHLPWLESLSVNYLLITPYTYTHYDGNGNAGDKNYLNYTSQGVSLGPALDPDSDRIEVQALMRPFLNLNAKLFVRFLRHGNGSEGIPGGGDGTIFDPGYVNSVPTFTVNGGYVLPSGIIYWTRFMTQSVIEKVFQSGFALDGALDTAFGTFKAKFSYTFEYIWNYQLQPIDKMTNYFGLQVGYAY